MLHKSVGTNDDEEANDTLEQTNGAGLGEVEAVHHGAVYVGLNDVRGLEEHGVVANQVVEQTEVTLEDAADGKQEEDHHGGFQRCNGYAGNHWHRQSVPPPSWRNPYR